MYLSGQIVKNLVTGEPIVYLDFLYNKKEKEFYTLWFNFEGDIVRGDKELKTKEYHKKIDNSVIMDILPDFGQSYEEYTKFLKDYKIKMDELAKNEDVST
jgi:hypothetical protein